MAMVNRKIREEGVMKTEKSISQPQGLAEEKKVNYAIEVSWCCGARVFYLPMGPFKLPACSRCWMQTFPVFILDLKEKS
jgi:hypothetical protein